MKRILPIYMLLALINSIMGASIKISDLPLAASPSTNTFLEVADMNAVTKSSKYLLTNLVKTSQLKWEQSTDGSVSYLAPGTTYSNTVYIANSNAALDSTAILILSAGRYGGNGLNPILTNSCFDVYLYGASVANQTIMDAWGDVIGIGGGTLSLATKAATLRNVVAIGNFAMGFLDADQINEVIAVGSSALSSSTLSGSEHIVSIGYTSLSSASLGSGVSEIIAIGSGALSGSVLTNSQTDIVAIGKSAGQGISGDVSNVVLLGKNSTIASGSHDLLALGPSMAISTGGDTNRWIFKGVSGDGGGVETNITVNVNGKNYMFKAW